jgi:hypothetical protein
VPRGACRSGAGAPRTAGRCQSRADSGEQSEREPLRTAARDDRQSRAVCLDSIADEDSGEQRESYLALRDSQAERDRLGDAVDDGPGGDASPRAAAEVPRDISNGRPAAAA